MPILLRVGDLIQANNYWVKALSIYPRTELLKDQLAETFKRSRMLDQALIDNGKRPILMGAFFGSTPTKADYNSVKNKWDRIAKEQDEQFLLQNKEQEKVNNPDI